MRRNSEARGPGGDDTATVAQLGERGVLARILRRLRPADAAVLGPGDDCAVLRAVGDTVVTTDTMIEGPDFRLAWHSGFELGWKLAATNLSDVAAMGARPIALTAAFAVPADTPASLLEQVAEGLDAACAAMAPGVGVVGGDLGRAPVMMASVTAMGDLAGRTPVTRSGARSGHVIAYAGDLGLSGSGLSLLFERAVDERGEASDAELSALWAEYPDRLAAQLAPSPPIELGVAAAEAGASAMMDVSDGLSLDAERLAVASGIAIDLDSRALVAGFGVQYDSAVDLRSMLHGGEDHGLLAAFPHEASLPPGFVVIGRAVPPTGAEALLLDGEAYASAGWDPYTVPSADAGTGAADAR